MLSFVLQPQNSSGADATGRIQLASSTSFILTLSITGLAPGSVHASHIHKGACGGIGPIAAALRNVVADPSGTATVATQVDELPYSIPAEGWYANVHAGPDLTGPNAKGILCGNLPAP